MLQYYTVHMHAMYSQTQNNTYTTRNPAIAEGPRDAGVPVEIW